MNPQISEPLQSWSHSVDHAKRTRLLRFARNDVRIKKERTAHANKKTTQYPVDRSGLAAC